jgi:hypothetical protein
LKGKRARLSKKLDPVDPSSPPSPVVVEVEDEVRPRSFRRSVSKVVNDVDDVDDAAGDARLCSDVGTEESNCDSVDCTPVPVDVPAAWVTAAAWLAAPAGLVVDGGDVNAVNLEAAAELPA